MESIALQVILQLPIVALLFFAAFLFRGLQRERNNLAAAIQDFEARIASAPGTSGGPDKGLLAELEKLKARVESVSANIDSSESDREKTREYMANQKTALKEFGRVLSRTSEQTYGELQSMEARIRVIEASLNDTGFELDPSVSEAA